jgi:hypothetical protein
VCPENLDNPHIHKFLFFFVFRNNLDFIMPLLRYAFAQ